MHAPVGANEDRHGPVYWIQFSKRRIATAVVDRRDGRTGPRRPVLRAPDGTGVHRLPRQLSGIDTLWRYFKLTGYTIGKVAISSQGVSYVPMAVMAQASVTNTRNNNTIDPATGETM